jgi:hypothetical protein
MVLHTSPTLRKSYIDIIIGKYTKISKKSLNALATDRLEYLSNLITESEPNAESELFRVLGIKAKFNYCNDDRKFTFADKNSIKTNFVNP